jgi:DNA-binding cell septation regulator SpoVG
MQIEIIDLEKKNGPKTKGYVTVLLFKTIKMTFRLRLNKFLYIEMPKVKFENREYHCIYFIDKIQSDAFQKQVLALIDTYEQQKSIAVKADKVKN